MNRKTAEEDLPAYQVRPRFEVEVKEEPEEILEVIRAHLRTNIDSVKARIIPGFVTFFVPEAEQHFWSPQLSLSIEEIEGGSLLRGMYGPSPSVWTMFVFFYAAIGFAIMVVSIVGLSNWSLEKSATILWLVPILMLAFLSLYLVAYSGQKLGHDQMVTLHGFMEETLERRIE